PVAPRPASRGRPTTAVRAAAARAAAPPHYPRFPKRSARNRCRIRWRSSRRRRTAPNRQTRATVLRAVPPARAGNRVLRVSSVQSSCRHLSAIRSLREMPVTRHRQLQPLAVAVKHVATGAFDDTTDAGDAGTGCVGCRLHTRGVLDRCAETELVVVATG